MMVGQGDAPRRWLDVGAGHGHFCLAAREVWPQTELHGLDLSEGVEIGARRGWIDVGIRGLFPDKARELRARYDVVSMSHYLEHTRDPEAEVRAATVALGPGGHLLVEIPDPESRLRHVLRSFWIPWFQPQHQHFLRAAALDAMLRRNGFEPVLWHRGQAHQRVDFVLGALLLLARIAGPRPDLPWRARRGVAGRAWYAFAWTLGFPAIAAAYAFDRMAGPLCSREGWSNTLRVLARKVAEPGAGRAPAAKGELP
jgi:SAM-dependent methyltransferase